MGASGLPFALGIRLMQHRQAALPNSLPFACHVRREADAKGETQGTVPWCFMDVLLV